MSQKKKLKKASVAKLNRGFHSSQPSTITIGKIPLLKEKPPPETIPTELRINGKPGIFFGAEDDSSYIGAPQGTEGNILVVGGNGSGKSTGIAMPTLITWQGAICATDIKGELSNFYVEQYRQGAVIRPYIIFDPTQMDSPSYDPFWLLSQDGENNVFNDVCDLARIIAPVSPEDREPYWAETEQGVLAAALLHYFNCGLSFSEAMCRTLSVPMRDLCDELTKDPDPHIRMLLGEMADMKPETMANFDRGLRNKIMVFAADPLISHAFRGEREGAVCFNWDDLKDHNIFLRIPADKIEQWGTAVNLMYSQLFRYLERRPEMYSAEWESDPQTLILMDEFARFGKLDKITAAMSTLRSKNVNICLMIQSIAQLDCIYGEKERRIICDNCQFKVILRANDADTQKYLGELIGTCTCIQNAVSAQKDQQLAVTGYSVQLSETQDWIIQPHMLATLKDVLLLTPYGFCRARKRLPNEAIPSPIPRSSTVNQVADHCDPAFNGAKKNKGAKLKPIKDRISTAFRRIAESPEHQESHTAMMQNRGEQDDRLRAIGELVAKYLPELCRPESQCGEGDQFQSLRAFLGELTNDREVFEQIQKGAKQRCISGK